MDVMSNWDETVLRKFAKGHLYYKKSHGKECIKFQFNV